MTRLPAFVLAALVIAGCSASDSVESTEPDPTPSTAETTTSVEPSTTTTVADTTTTVPESTTTVESTTTTITTTTPTTVAATSTTTAPTASLPGPAPTPPERAFVTNGSDLLEVDAATGATVATVVEFFNGDGLFRGDLRLSPDRSTIWFSEGYEDGWYGCESSVGSFGRVDVATGAVEIVGLGAGIAPEPSPDGTLLARLDSSLCIPDPENPEFWVLTPYDRVVVRDLASGSERTFVTEPAPQDYASPSQVEWAGFTSAGELLVRTADERLRRVDLDGSGVLQDHPVVIEELRGLPIGTIGGWLATVEYGDEGSTDVYAVDLETGTTARLATSEGFVAAGISAEGAIVVTGFTDVEVEPDAPVTVLVPPADVTYFDVDW